MKALAGSKAVSDCGSLGAYTEGKRVFLTGHVAAKAPLQSALQELVPPLPFEVDLGHLEELPWPQCEIRGDYGVRNLKSGFALQSEDLPKAGPVLGGTSFSLTVSTPKVPAFLYVFYIQAQREGNVVPLYQPLFDKAGKPMPSQLRGRVNLNEPVPGLRQEFVVKAPYGPEAVLMLASRKPLFPAQVPSGDWNERELLTRLRLRYLELRKHGDILATDAIFLTTAEAPTEVVP